MCGIQKKKHTNHLHWLRTSSKESMLVTVEELFKRLSFGQLSNLAMGSDGQGTIRLEDQNKVINALNSALVRIYTRFNMLEKQLMIQQVGHITNYHLDKRFSRVNPDRLPQHPGYLLDLPNEPFNDDAVKILAVFNKCGEQLPLNVSLVQTSLYTPYPTTLQVPYPDDGEPLGLLYQATHERLRYGVKEAEVRIPVALEDALLSLTAYYIYSAIGTQEATAKASEHLNLFDVTAKDVEAQGAASIFDQAGHIKFQLRGFV